MSDPQIVIFSIVQGLTEFFPVSSSAHLILLNRFLGWEDSGLVMDIAVHLGTLGAICVYFRKDVSRLFYGVFDLCQGRITTQARLLLLLVCTTLPLIGTGFVLDRFWEGSFRTTAFIGWCTLIFGLLLQLADRFSRNVYTLSHITFRESFWGWGMAQALAVFHGVSRSGISLTMGRFMGYTRSEAAHFSFLMAIPAITAAGALKGFQFCCAGDWTLLRPAFLGMGVSFIAGLGAISLLMLWLRYFSLTLFALYRVALGIILLVSVYI